MVRFRQRGKSFSLTPTDKADEDSETPFGDTLLGYVSKYNAAHQSQPDALIHHRGFYDTWWAKALTVFTYLMFAGVVIMRITTPEKVGTWRMIQVATLGVMWLSAYYTNRRHSKAKYG
jgi:hypothetical protein